MISLSSYSRQLRIVLFGLLSISGLSFWFFLGFPFANHNESYLWLVNLNRLGIVDVLTNNVSPPPTFRPLGMATAWVGYRLSGGSIFPQQAFNYLGAALAWLILFSATKEKKLFGWVSILAGGAFFSGYIYLFHLHGVFYSPLLIFLAFLLARAISHNGVETSWLLVESALVVFTSLYHTFAVPIYVAFMLGYFLENRRFATRKQLIIGSLLLVAYYGLVSILAPNKSLVLTTNTMLGLLTSYKMVELNLAVSVASWSLSILAIISLNVSGRMKLVLGGVITALSLAFVLLNAPVVAIWIAVSLLKSVLIKKWSITFLILTTAMLPAATGTGSPMYSIFVLMVCTYVTPLGYSVIEKDSVLHDRVALASIMLVIAATVLLKADIHLPIVSRLVNPLLAEKEKTFQMENIIKWMMASDFRENRLILCEDARQPVMATNAVNRRHRPPTSQFYLDVYFYSLRTRQPNNSAGQLTVCFGGAEIDNAELVYNVEGKYSGGATVWKQTK